MQREEYDKLVQDTRKFIQDLEDPSKVLLTSHSFPPPVHPQRQPAETIPRPLPPPPQKESYSKVQTTAAPKPLVQKVEAQQTAAPKPIVSPPRNTAMKELMAQVAPQIKIIDEIPSDTDAKKIAEGWKEGQLVAEVTLLSFNEPENERRLLFNLASAINTRLRPARLIDGRRIELEQKWNLLLGNKGIRIVLASPNFSSSSGLMQHYKELPATDEKFLGEKPFFILAPLSTYLKNPTYKISLWHKLSTLLS